MLSTEKRWRKRLGMWFGEVYSEGDPTIDVELPTTRSSIKYAERNM